MKKGTRWSREELLIAFRLYCSTPFGRLHQHNPEIKRIANLLGRTPSAVAMKSINFASLAPIHQARNVSALGNVSRADRDLWSEFDSNAESLAVEIEQVWEQITEKGNEQPNERVEKEKPPLSNLRPPSGPTEFEKTVQVRRVQRFFRTVVLNSYGNQCAISGIPLPDLLNASHIIPWSENVERRADPRNGIALHALYDRAFDRGYISFDENLCVILSPELRVDNASRLHVRTLLDLDGCKLNQPDCFPPDPEAIAWHRETVFRC